MGFQPDYLHYMRAFDLPRSDSVTAASPAAATPHIPVDPIPPFMIVPLGAPIGLRRSKSLTGKPGAGLRGARRYNPLGDAVAHALGILLEHFRLGIDAQDRGLQIIRQADVERRALIEIEPALGAEGEVLPEMVGLLRQAIDEHLRRRGVAGVLYVVEADDALALRDEQSAVLEGDAVRGLSPLAMTLTSR